MVALGRLPNGSMPWTAEEDEILRATWPVGGSALAVEKLPHRTVAASRFRASQLKISCKPGWSKSDVNELQFAWESGATLEEIAKRLGRTPYATYVKARSLGLGSVPDGYERLKHAARRTGYDAATLRRVLRWAGVKEHAVLAAQIPGGAPRRSHRRVFVDPEAVNSAIAAWHMTETVAMAAERLGVDAENLRRWMRAAEAFKGFGKREVPRAFAEVFDSVVEQHRRAEFIGDAAERVGLHQWTLSKWLIEAGVLPSDRRVNSGVLPEVVDRVVAERRAKETPAVAARRHGVCEQTLRRWLGDAGFERPGRKCQWLLWPREIDAVVAKRRGGVK